MTTAAARRLPEAASSSPVIVPQLALVPPPSTPTEAGDVDADSLVDLLAGERGRQNRTAWLYVPLIIVGAGIVLLDVAAFMSWIAAAVFIAASLGNLWIVYRSIDEECRELGIDPRSMRRALRRVYRRHRADLAGLSGLARDRAVAELVLTDEGVRALLRAPGADG